MSGSINNGSPAPEMPVEYARVVEAIRTARVAATLPMTLSAIIENTKQLEALHALQQRYLESGLINIGVPRK